VYWKQVLIFFFVTLTIGVGRAIKERKLTPNFIRSYQIIERVGDNGVLDALPKMLSSIHDLFNMSQLRKYVLDPS
jgi:hypothetical protein